MKHSSTIFLRVVVILLGILVLTLFVYGLPILIKSEMAGDFDYGIIFVGLYLTTIPFFLALFQAFKLLNYIDKNEAFSELSVKALQNIKYCALTISGLFSVGMPYIFYLGDKDDAPGIVALGFVMIGASFVIAVFSAVLQKLLINAIDIKSENDLTV